MHMHSILFKVGELNICSFQVGIIVIAAISYVRVWWFAVSVVFRCQIQNQRRFETSLLRMVGYFMEHDRRWMYNRLS